MVAFNPKHFGGRGRLISEFKVNLVYKVSYRIVQNVQRNLGGGGQNNFGRLN